MSTLTQDEVSRYSRQLILPQIGSEGQLKLKNSSVLIVGCGGLGCPSSQYLAAAGIGRMGLVDDDLVEKSNLHRQVLHNESKIGMAKTDSAAQFLQELNRNVVLDKYQIRLNRSNAVDLIKQFDVIVDATDNATTRYLLSDASVVCKKPLVSGAALRFEGQLTVYNYDETTPCYRCLFPNPPPPGTVTNCSEGGVLGVVPGIIGSLQALEVIKILVGQKPSFAGKMLLFDGLEGIFRTVKIRQKKEDCISCGKNPQIGPELIDYEQFCGQQCNKQATPQPLKILDPHERISVHQYNEVVEKKQDHVLIDVRPKVEVDIVKLPQAISIPLKQLQTEKGLEQVEDLIEDTKVKTIYVMCRRGNASQIGVRFLKDNLKSASKLDIKDVEGGITAWSGKIDPNMPIY